LTNSDASDYGTCKLQLNFNVILFDSWMFVAIGCNQIFSRI
jgi:hypothetical protein